MSPEAETPSPEMIDRVRRAVASAEVVLVISGAGVSAESGVPTFRAPGGWWRKLDPKKLATVAAFRTDPVTVWQWYEFRRGIVAGAAPNPGHIALSRLERSGRRVAIVTQNVDDLHERAGSTEVIHIHGFLWRTRCTVEGKVSEDRRVSLGGLPPVCGSCGGNLRPDIVWFDEELPSGEVTRVEGLLRGRVDVVLVVGTEATFDYISEWAIEAQRKGAMLVEVNPERTQLSPRADVCLRGPAGSVLPAVCRE